jgi:general secretion pathway protein G
MINKKNKSGFTLIELLVVIAIIALISTLAAVYFNTARLTARDSRRLMDIKEIQLALKMFYNDTGFYPTAITAGSSIANGGTNYLLRVPANPTPRDDNNCPDQEYYYQQLEAGQRFSLGFCLGDKTDELDGGVHTATANGILNCPTGYVAVPGSATFDTNDFCVMKYEAKCANASAPTIGLSDPSFLTINSTYDNGNISCTAGNSLIPVSVSSGYPIGNINQTNALAYCQTIGGHLLTNPEWMTIARNLEAVTANWSNDSIGHEFLSAGNKSGGQAMDGSNIYPSGIDFAFRRTSYLSSGEIIWDFSGNVNEWLDATCHQADYYDSGGNPVEWNDTNITDFMRGASGPSSNSYGRTQNSGDYVGCANENNVFLRGGSADDTIRAGFYGLDLRNNNVTANNLAGFRCVK